MSTDRIEKKVVLEAPVERVWRAVSDSAAFGKWFGVAFDGPFVAREKLTGHIVPTIVDAEVAAMQKPYEGKPFEFVVEGIEPMSRISFRWHPFAIEPGVDYSHEPMTLIVFALEEARPADLRGACRARGRLRHRGSRAGGTECVQARRLQGLRADDQLLVLRRS